MADGNHIAVTVQGSWGYPSAYLVIGNDSVNLPSTVANGYWYVVVDLTSLNVVDNEVSTNTSSLPPGVAKYANNPQYLLVFTTVGLTTDNVPQGSLYQFLRSIGAGYQLARIEQINEQLGTGTFGAVGYILATSLAQDGGIGFEESSFYNIPILTFELMPVTVNGQTIYAPIQTGT